ncbi:hypothetical protein BCR33DRAFT_854762 [Rhizoclosmatium globosum]|uniref:Mediator of RNA polymerase II transcription subunit 11 n=1 Tax=Rhizoclosmatium globosum TaxID=329046 RepID=A0A1Y2BRX8_9FUNG|nr:hypothetical protein HDU79_006110 [Rhizoclosmatium sp. JEL0117]ORY37483.1 hypothetical protein BCR33DRAFT_854762 [Rhizoclosmatium globosum]|eukprot:ORY37483.1 hypothetical protein BCR33DRAFT_854762 [Rhizoclosmatium globosum]
MLSNPTTSINSSLAATPSTGNNNNQNSSSTSEAPSSTATTNEHHLNLIAAVEQKIVLLVQAAAKVVQSLAFEAADLDDRKDEFTNSHKEFTELLMDIQKSLRIVFKHLANAGILTASNASTASVKLAGDLTTALQMSSLPYQSTVEGFETDHELSVESLHVLLGKVRGGMMKHYGIDLSSGLGTDAIMYE